jgi:glycosyltransferase involved in cell wall biosynthesis
MPSHILPMKLKMKLCILSSVHSPFDVRIFHKEAKSLAEAGYQVTIVAPYSGSVRSNDIEVKALPPPHSRGERMVRTAWKIYRAARQTGASVYHFHDPELIPVGTLLKLQGGRIVYDVHEDVPQDILDKAWIPLGMRKLASKAAGLLEAFGALVFDEIVAATPGIAQRFPKEKTSLVQNFPRLEALAELGALPYSERQSICVYVGGITSQRCVREMIHAISLLPQSLGARLRLAGAFGPPELEREVKRMAGWDRVEFLGWLSRESVGPLLHSSRVGIVLFKPLPGYTEAQPNKLFEYMAAGLPVIASDFPLWREIVGGAGCGLLVDPENPQAIAQAIRWLLEHPQEAEEMGQRGAEAVRATYNWDKEEEKLLDLYRRLANGVNP